MNPMKELFYYHFDNIKIYAIMILYWNFCYGTPL